MSKMFVTLAVVGSVERRQVRRQQPDGNYTRINGLDPLASMSVVDG